MTFSFAAWHTISFFKLQCISCHLSRRLFVFVLLRSHCQKEDVAACNKNIYYLGHSWQSKAPTIITRFPGRPMTFVACHPSLTPAPSHQMSCLSLCHSAVSCWIKTQKCQNKIISKNKSTLFMSDFWPRLMILAALNIRGPLICCISLNKTPLDLQHVIVNPSGKTLLRETAAAS